ncbi:Oidioi.mRNA.OKI2018_I69.PAR.g12231.t2.cds [Oikopleura dioica]|uniref:Oidioi.mRNA.OKI2018_I69.PAR.g12231.t2.cds n=1 Tax=Oikopleura dioica TaxID=34765 RepID=A0ABN7S6Q7_OIKDI|nr:Oidioi.mRNA.OKI2018_I69.PAR.g12231.t2.cds [Oikopleura dioica]
MPNMNKRLKVDPEVIEIEEASEDMRIEDVPNDDIPGPSNRYIPPPPSVDLENQGLNNNGNIEEFRERRRAILDNVTTSLTEMENDYYTIADLNKELLLDRQARQRLKRDIDELDAEIQQKTAKKDVLDNAYKKLSKRIDENEKSLDKAHERIRTFEVCYKKVEPKPEEKPGQVGEFECPICKEICGTEEKHMVCLSSCGHRFCKDCIDRVLDDAPMNGQADNALFNGAGVPDGVNRRDQLRRDAEEVRQERRRLEQEVRNAANRYLLFRQQRPAAVVPQPPAARAADNNAAAPVANVAVNPPANPPPRHNLYFPPQFNQGPAHVVRARAYDPRFNQRLYNRKRCPTCQTDFSRNNVVRLF